MIFVVIFSVRFSVLKYSILKHTGFWLFFARLPQLLSGSFPVSVYVIRKVVDKAFSVKTCDFEFGFPFWSRPNQTCPVSEGIWKDASDHVGGWDKGSEGQELVVPGRLITCPNSQRCVIVLLHFEILCFMIFPGQNSNHHLTGMECSANRSLCAPWLFRLGC